MQKKNSALRLVKMFLFHEKLSTVIMIVCSAVGVGMIAASAFLGASYGDTDYYTSVYILFLAFYLICLFPMVFLINVIYSRFFYSTPRAKKAMTVTNPMIIAGLCAAVTVLSVVLTGISFSVGLVDGNRMSDVLLVCAACSFLIMTCYSLGNSTGQGLLGLVFGIGMLFFAFVSAVPEPQGSWTYRLCCYGLGVPAELAAVLCALAFAVGIPLSLCLARIGYRRRSSKAMVNLTPVPR